MPTSLTRTQLLESSWQSKHCPELISAAKERGFPVREHLAGGVEDAFSPVKGLINRLLFDETTPLVICSSSQQAFAAASRFWVSLASKGAAFREAQRLKAFVGGDGHEYSWVHAVYPILLLPYTSQHGADELWSGALRGGYELMLFLLGIITAVCVSRWSSSFRPCHRTEKWSPASWLKFQPANRDSGSASGSSQKPPVVPAREVESGRASPGVDACSSGGVAAFSRVRRRKESGEAELPPAAEEISHGRGVSPTWLPDLFFVYPRGDPARLLAIEEYKKAPVRSLGDDTKKDDDR